MRSNMTGVGVHNSEYRRFNRSFGRGNPKPFQPSQRQPSPQRNRRSDLFVEAGRLAVEYLVSHGLLSSNVLSSKTQSGILRNNSGEFQNQRSSRDREISNSHVDGRSVSTARQRAASPDGASGRRRSPNDQDPSLSTNSYSRGRRRYGISRSNSYELNHENEREGSLSDKATAYECMEATGDKFPNDTSKDAATHVCDSRPAQSASTDDKHCQLQDELGKSGPHDDSNSKITSAFQHKDVKELPKPSNGVDATYGETRDGTGDLKELEALRDQLAVEHYEENNETSERGCMDLLKLCPSTEIPSEVYTSMSSKSPSGEPLMLTDGNNASDIGCDSTKSAKVVTTNDSSEIPSSNENHGSNFVGLALSERSFREAGALYPACAVNPNKSVESLSFTDSTFSYEQKSNGLSELGSCSNDRGEKRPIEDDNMGDGAKRAKQWLSVSQSDEYSQLSDLSEKQSISQANRTVAVNIFNDCDNQESFTDISLPLKGNIESTIQQGEQKQLFSSSFKICDLNLMEASDMHENHNVSGLLYPSISAPNKNAAVDVDLSMNNNYSLTSGYNDHGAAKKDIEIIDLESASLQEVGNMDTSTRNMEGGISNMASFPSNTHNCNDNPDGQDGYGFMISELLGNDVPNCSSVQPDINSLHNDMGLHHGEGIFGEDDQIYMSLGEISINLLRGWEQPTQERNPFEL